MSAAAPIRSLRRALLRWGALLVAVGAAVATGGLDGAASAPPSSAPGSSVPEGAPASSLPDGVPAAVSGPASVDPLAPATKPVPARHVFPVVSTNYRYTRSHHDYPATDVSVACGTRLVAITDGVIWEVERVDRWNPSIDIPGTRGGRTVVIDGDDGARYLYAHFATIVSGLAVGQRVGAGDTLGTVGSTGRSTGCHLHLGLSPQCPTRVWDRLAGTIWPWPYFDAWLQGTNVHPGAELADWLAANPGGCGNSAVVAPDPLVDQGPELVFPTRRSPGTPS